MKRERDLVFLKMKGIQIISTNAKGGEFFMKREREGGGGGPKYI